MRPFTLMLGLVIIVVVFFAVESCTKPHSNVIDSGGTTTPPNTDTTKTPPNQNPPVTKTRQPGTWECDVDGVHYSGTIDTSFTQIVNPTYSHPDTLIEGTGTASNKKANIHIRFTLNRYVNINIDLTTFVQFDTCMTGYYYNYSNGTPRLTCKADSLVGDSLYGSFSGALAAYNTVINNASSHILTNGKFLMNLGAGNSEPKFFTSTTGSFNQTGYINYARVTSNTLILDGLPFSSNLGDRFKLIVRTGGTIKPGTYESAKGNVGLVWNISGLDRAFIDDSTGDLRVTIASVAGDVVTGSFSGINYDGKSLTGTFSCRVKDYIPQIDLANKWSFGEGETIFGYRLFGGNVLNASLSQNAGRYLLTVNGESDNGQAVFKMVLSSTASIAAGNYVGSFMNMNNHIDSLYFSSPVKIWNGNNTYLYSDDASQFPVYVTIDSIDQQKVVGTIWGKIRIMLNSGSITSAYIKEGKFSASF